MKPPISPRETEVLHLIANELSAPQIAHKLFISPHTVITHRKNLQDKLGAKNTAGLIRRAYEYGLLKIALQPKETSIF